MQELLAPLSNPSLKDVFIERFEDLILSGQLKIGQKLPSERELALRLGVSRPVVHSGLIDLETKGLVTLTPRVGAVVNDYRLKGSLALLNSLVAYHQGDLESDLLTSLLAMRRLFEMETARLAAIHRDERLLSELGETVAAEAKLPPREAARIAALDFRFHHLLALASGNRVYPLLINSFKQVYVNLTTQFFQDPSVVETVHALHRQLYAAVADRDPSAAADVMDRLLTHGADHLPRNDRTG